MILIRLSSALETLKDHECWGISVWDFGDSAGLHPLSEDTQRHGKNCGKTSTCPTVIDTFLLVSLSRQPLPALVGTAAAAARLAGLGTPLGGPPDAASQWGTLDFLALF
jgi:hypothetical protein